MTVVFEFVQPPPNTLEFVQPEVGFLGFQGTGLPGISPPGLFALPFSQRGPATLSSSSQRWYADYPMTLVKARLSTAIAADADVVFKAMLNGADWLTLTLAAGDLTVLEDVDLAPAVGDYLTPHVTAIGSPAAPGADLSVTLWMQLTP